MKKFILMCCLLFGISLAGCGGREDADANYMTINDRIFYNISSDDVGFNGRSWDIYVDTETRVQYIIFFGDQSYSASVVVLVDADGKPILYEGEL